MITAHTHTPMSVSRTKRLLQSPLLSRSVRVRRRKRIRPSTGIRFEPIGKCVYVFVYYVCVCVCIYMYVYVCVCVCVCHVIGNWKWKVHGLLYVCA